MKNIKNLSYLVLIAFSFVLLTQCNDDSEEFVVSPVSTFSLAEQTITSLQLDPVNTSNEALTLSWVEPDYGQQVSINYEVQFSSDDAFSNPVVGGSITGNNTLSFTVNELNNAVGNAGLPAFNWNLVYIRIVSSLGTQNGETITSNNISLNVYPFFNYVFEDYFLVGDATSPGWSNDNNNTFLFRNPDNSDEFNYTGHFTTGAFKVLETKGFWQPQWGTNDASTIDVNPGGGTDPGTFPLNNNAIAAAGNYSFTINFSTNTFTFTPYTTAAVVTPAAVMIQGSASASPVAMTQLAFDSDIWYANSIRLVPGDFQFMADGTGWGSTTEFSGTSTSGGGNIPVPVEDDYDVWFNGLTGQYIFIPLNL